jgi:hypothetical protein
MIDFRDITARVLAAEGTIVEEIDPDGLEMVVPERIRAVLSLPEWCRPGFGVVLPEKAARVSLESDWPDRLERILGSRGRVFSAALVEEFLPLSAAELERRVRHSLVLENATLRVLGGEQALTRYPLLIFRVTCSSEEKLHCLCNACLAPCPSCQREVCLACSRAQCGRCACALPAADQGRGPAV